MHVYHIGVGTSLSLGREGKGREGKGREGKGRNLPPNYPVGKKYQNSDFSLALWEYIGIDYSGRLSDEL